MQMFKHAYFSLKQNRIYTVITFLFLLLYFILLFGLLDSSNGFKKEIEKVKKIYRAQVMIIPSELSLSEEDEDQSLSLEELKKYGASAYLEKSEYIGYLLFEQEPAVKADEEAGQASEAYSVTLMGQSLENMQKNIAQSVAVGDTELTKDECLISEEYAEMKKLAVGDSVTLQHEQGEISLTVKGIYQEDIIPAGWTTVYTTIDAIEQTELSAATYWSALYYLKDDQQMSEFANEASGKGLSDAYRLYSNENSAYQETIWLEEALKKSKTAFMLFFFSGSLVLFGLTVLGKKRQLNEIGYLFSSGISKRKQRLLHAENNLIMLTAAVVLAAVVVKFSIVGIAQFLLTLAMSSSGIEAINFMTVGSVAEYLKPIESITTVTSVFSFEKWGLAAIAFLTATAYKCYLIGQFHIDSRLAEEGFE